MPYGTLYGIGLGPGDPELITLKGLRILQQSRVIAYPISRQGDESVALSILERITSLVGKEKIELLFPMSAAEPAALKIAWEEASRKIAAHLEQGKDVAFITLGDVVLYSTFIYLFEVMREGYQHLKVEFVPGISSVSASAATASLPLGKGRERLAILPAPFDQAQLKKSLEDFDTVVLLKVSQVFDQVYELLKRMNLLDKAILCQRIGLEGERIIHDLSTLVGSKVDYMSILMVKK